MVHGQVTINKAEQHQAHAVTDVEPDPGLPHRRTTRDTWHNALHRRLQLSFDRSELVREERVREMHAAEEQDDRSTSDNQGSRDHNFRPRFRYHKNVYSPGDMTKTWAADGPNSPVMSSSG